MADPTDRFEAQPNVGNHFAWLRTQMALQRTLLAAVRTSVSLIGFGFTVAQFFQKMQGSVPDNLRTFGTELPRNLGLVLIGAGLFSLATFTWQYRTANLYLRSGAFAALAPEREKSMRTSSYLVSFTVMLIGVAAFVSVFARF